MNKIQLAGVWIGSLALAVYFCLKQDVSYYIAAGGVVALAAIITYRATRRHDHGHNIMTPDSKQTTAAAANVSGNDENTVTLPKYSGGYSLVFKKESLVCREKTYNYKNITGIFYQTVALAVHGIPTSQNYMFGIKSTDGDLTVSLASVFYLNNKVLSGLYGKLVTLALLNIQPYITANFLREIFKHGKAVKIGGLEFTNKGYSKKKLFGGLDSVAWSDRVYIPQVFEGYVYVYKDKDGKHRKFKTLSTRVVNAVILPELVQQCYDEANGIKP